MAFLVKDKITEPLFAIVPYFNPWRWKTREKHTLRALKHFHDSGAVIILVEAAFGNRDFVWADSGLDKTAAECNIAGTSEFRHIYVPLRTHDELWLKENLINIGVSRIPTYNWNQVCWLDSDILFLRPNWVGETIHKLQHYKFLQMFSHARDLSPSYELMPESYPHAAGVGFIHSWKKVKKDLRKIRRDLERLEDDIEELEEDLFPQPYGSGKTWPGLAWACTRQAWNEVGGLIDFAIWGGGDWHMSHALIEDREKMVEKGIHPNYKAMVDSWADNCQRYIRKNVGLVEGTVAHNWHGKKTQRGYGNKHQLLAKIGFDPIRHLKRDHQGLYQLHDDGSEAHVLLRDAMRKIAHERNEDANETGLELSANSH